MKKLWLKMIDSFRFKHIMNAALNAGCDTDGDLIVYKNVAYVVFIFDNIIMRANSNIQREVKQCTIAMKNL